MDAREEIRDFLSSRRARLKPASESVLDALARATPSERTCSTATSVPTPPATSSSTRSDEFRRHWAAHDVRFHISGVKDFHHPVVGDIQLHYERLEVVWDTGLTIFAYTAEPGTRSAEALSLLGSWAATEAVDVRSRR